MLHNLKIEWMKIRNYRVFQVFSILYLLGILLIIYIFYRAYMDVLSQIQSAMSNGVDREANDIFNFFTPLNIWKTVMFATSFLLYLPGMVIILLFINEVNFKTHRQNIIDGWTRETFIYTKISLIASMAAVITIMNLIATIVMCYVTDTRFAIEGAYNLIYCFLQSFVYLMFALLLATLFRRSGIAIIVFFIYGLILEWVFFWLVQYANPSMGHLLPLQAADSLTILPNLDVMLKSVPQIKYVALAAIIYGLVYIWLTIRKFKYDDL